MARILIGNVKGPTGATGSQGVQGPRGVQGIQGPLPPLINNGLATVAGESALDAVMGKTLQDQITQQNSDLAGKVSNDSNNHSISLSYDDDGRTNIKIDTTTRPLPVNTNSNYAVMFMEMAINPGTSNRALKLIWIADGKTYTNYLDCTK